MPSDDRHVLRAPSLRGCLALSLAMHGAIFVSILGTVALGRAASGRTDGLSLSQQQAQEEERKRQEEDQARQAEKEALRDQMAEQLQAEMDSLAADELAPPDERRLSEMTAEDISQLVEDADLRRDLEELAGEDLASLMEQLRGQSLEEMRENLKRMRQDLLLSQVRAFVRRVVAPEIQQKIDQRLKTVLGERIRAEAARLSHAEKAARLEEAGKELRAAIGELNGLKRQQDEVRAGLERKQTAAAAAKQRSLAELEPNNTSRIEAALKRVEDLSPASADLAKSLRDVPEEKSLAPAIGKAAAAIAAAQAAEARKAATTAPAGKAEAEASAAQERSAAAARAQDASARMAARAAELGGLAARLTEEGKQRAPDEIQKKVVGEALADVEEAVRKEVEKEVKDTAVPVAAERIVKALEQDLTKRRLNTQEFKDFLEKDIRKALAEEMDHHKPDATLAGAKTRTQFELRDRKTVEEARAEVAEVARKLKALAEAEEKLRGEVSKETAAKDAPRQRKMANDIRDVQAEAGQALATARRATARQDAAVDQASAEVKKPAAAMAERAAKALEREAIAEANQPMVEAAAALKRSADLLEQLEQGLAQEAAEVKGIAGKDVDLKKALGEARAGQAVGEVKQGARKQVEEQTRPEVALAAKSVKVDGALQGEEELAALARMDALDGKLEQMSANAADGRDLGGEAGAGLLGPGEGLGGLGGAGGQGWRGPWGGAMTRESIEAYRRFIEDMRNRLNPDNYYAEEKPTEGLDSVARADSGPGAALIFVERLPSPATEKAESNQARHVPPPAFVSKAFGAAAMMEKPVVIDGDLSDWGELRHPLKAQYKSTEGKVPGGPTVYVRWSPDGLYLCYTVQDPTGIQPCVDRSWSGDCFELMVDMANGRMPQAYRNPTAQKFDFTPFGFRGTAVSVVEVGRGLRGMNMAADYPDTKGVLGKSAGKIIPGGYSVEIFLSRRALARPLLVPGKYIALNYSLNTNYGDAGYQWSASQHIQTWQRPDTWGDVLLLGADAKVRFFDARDAAAPELKGIAPGDPVGIEIADADMNLNYLKPDRVAAEVADKELGTSLFVVLKETGQSTGVFRGSIDTQSHFLTPRPNTLNVRSGDALEVRYVDARAEYGEKDRKVTAELPVGWPVMKLTGK